jgi:hypothetical protein
MFIHPCFVLFIECAPQILGGYVLDAFLSPGTLCIKFVGLALAVASGLSLGKEVQGLYSFTDITTKIHVGSFGACFLLHGP